MDTTERIAQAMASTVIECPWCSAPAVLEPAWMVRCGACGTVVEVAPDASRDRQPRGARRGHRGPARRVAPVRRRPTLRPTIAAA